jgi:23S rRNA pseudouridine1911/1915/1917 synthase
MPSPRSIALDDPAATATAAGRIVFEDDSLVVVDKPSGLLTTPTIDAVRPSVLGRLAARTPGVRFHAVHRLDRLASGLLVVTKTPDATRSLARQVAARTVAREYEAVVVGHVAIARWTATHPIGDRPAVTHFATDEHLGRLATRLRCRLGTGRTHQIRIHARLAGHPVLGDCVHGPSTPNDPPRLALHAVTLAFVHPGTRARLTFESPWPEDLTPWLAHLRRRARLAEPTLPALEPGAER